MKTVSYVALCLLGLLGMTEAQFDAKKCQNYNDCPTTLCCGWATPQVARYGTRHKICYRPNQKLYMNYNGYKFDFECEPLPQDEIEEKIKEIEDPNNNNGGDNNNGNGEGDSQDLSDFNVDQSKYEKRFWSAFSPQDPENIPGYGVNKPWIAPLSSPQSLITLYDRYMVTSTLASNPIIMGIQMWIHGLGDYDSWDGYFYANAAAAGSQLYPTGLSKYYDVYSTDGLFAYTFGWIWEEIQALLLPLTFMVPIDIWFGLLSGASMKGLWKIVLFYFPFQLVSGAVPSLIALFFRVEMEDGWGIMYG